jgi:allantoin racemase
MAITGRMVAIALKHLEPGFSLEAATAASGAQLIVNEDQLGVAALAVAAMAPALAVTSDGVIVSAFGDPGIDELRKQLTQPVWIAESAMREAVRGQRRFSVLTTTPELVRAITWRAQGLGFGPRLASVQVADEPLEMLMSHEERLIAALARAADIAVRQDGAEAVIVGGGPLAAAADRLRRLLSVPVVEPTPTAVRDLQDRCSRGGEGLRAGSASQLRFVMRRRGDAPERTVRVAKRRPRSGTAGNSSSPRSPGPSSVRTATSNARRPM